MIIGVSWWDGSYATRINRVHLVDDEYAAKTRCGLVIPADAIPEHNSAVDPPICRRCRRRRRTR